MLLDKYDEKISESVSGELLKVLNDLLTSDCYTLLPKLKQIDDRFNFDRELLNRFATHCFMYLMFYVDFNDEKDLELQEELKDNNKRNVYNYYCSLISISVVTTFLRGVYKDEVFHKMTEGLVGMDYVKFIDNIMLPRYEYKKSASEGKDFIKEFENTLTIFFMQYGVFFLKDMNDEDKKRELKNFNIRFPEVSANEPLFYDIKFLHELIDILSKNAKEKISRYSFMLYFSFNTNKERLDNIASSIIKHI